VQNLFNLVNRKSEDVLDFCTREGVAFIPWYPLGAGKLAREGTVLDRTAKRLGATPAQVALAWVLARSPVMLPIPGTGSVAHLEENVAAAGLELTEQDVRELDREGREAH
jgi:aryl-alcohol dehydrogenase-like predicted oxidoreductase